MNNVIKEITGQVIGHTCWRAWRGVGSAIFFEFGKAPKDNLENKSGSGKYSLCLFTCSYDIRRGKTGTIILTSEDNLKKIENVIKYFENQKLQSIDVSERTKDTIIEFSNELLIQTFHGSKDQKWSLITPDITLIVGKNCRKKLEKNSS